MFTKKTNRNVSTFKIAFTLFLSLIFLISVSAVSAAAPHQSDFDSGNGSEDSPYNISNVDQLQNMNKAEYLNNNSVYFQLISDIDASDTINWNNGEGFVPIGVWNNQFTGIFDGNGYEITGLYINKPSTQRVGLFGSTNDAKIKNIGLIDVNITGQSRVGALVGQSNVGTISSSYSTGIVKSQSNVGGLVGINEAGTINDSYSTCDVIGNDFVGGLVGGNYGNSIITNSYTTGNVEGNSGVGGLVGQNSGTITNSYAIGNVEGNDFVGGLVGENQDTISDSYWDIETSGLDVSDGVGSGEDSGIFGNTTENLTYPNAINTFEDWDFTEIWSTHRAINDGYPYLQNLSHTYQIFDDGDGTSENPFQISNINQLQAMDLNLSANYTLINDVNASETKYWNGGDGFEPIGDISSNYFSGNLDGQGYEIAGLYINRTTDDAAGLFGYADSAEFENIGLVDVDITGGHHVGGLIGFSLSQPSSIKYSYVTGNVTGLSSVGGLVGYNLGVTVSNSYATGEVNGTNKVGGLVGDNSETIDNSYSSGTVEGNDYVGGLVGRNIGVTITDSYSTGDVIGNNQVGGLVGYNQDENITDSYSTGDVTGNNKVGGLVGRNIGLTIINSHSTGEVTGNNQVGGLVGENWGTIDNSYSTGEVTGNDQAGGLVGNNHFQKAIEGTITNSHSTGDVTGNDQLGGLVGINTGTINMTFSSGTVEGNNSVGGLVGQEGSDRTIENSYSISDVIGNNSVGGLVGLIQGGKINNSYSIGKVEDKSETGTDFGGLVGNKTGGVIEYSYWNIATSGIGSSDGVGNISNHENVTGKTTPEMKKKSTFEPEWDFTTIWAIDSRINNGYPYLQNLYDHYEIVEPEEAKVTTTSTSRRTSVAPSDNSDNVQSTSSSIRTVIPGKVNYDLSSSDTPVIGISFEALDNEGRVQTRVEVLSHVPENTPEPTGIVNSYMNINVGRTGTISSQNADNIMIHFTATWDWINENNIDPETIRVARYHNNEWQDLPTTQIDDDGEVIYFNAETTGFSLFSIIGDQRIDETSNDVNSEKVGSEEDERADYEQTPGFTALMTLLVVSIVSVAIGRFRKE